MAAMQLYRKVISTVGLQPAKKVYLVTIVFTAAIFITTTNAQGWYIL